MEAQAVGDGFSPDTYHALIESLEASLPRWKRHSELRRQALGLTQMGPWDLQAPLVDEEKAIPFRTALSWLGQALGTLGEGYVGLLRAGVLQQRWVDVFAHLGKTGQSFTMHVPGHHPYVLLNYDDDVDSVNAMAHELGHAMHLGLAGRSQPSMTVKPPRSLSEINSTLHQVMLWESVYRTASDEYEALIAVDGALSMGFRYLFMMPLLAGFERRIHGTAERGMSLTTEQLDAVMADLCQEGSGSTPADAVGFGRCLWRGWAGSPHRPFTPLHYALGLSLSFNLAQELPSDGSQPDRSRYVRFLKAGRSATAHELLDSLWSNWSVSGLVDAGTRGMERWLGRLERIVNGTTSRNRYDESASPYRCSPTLGSTTPKPKLTLVMAYRDEGDEPRKTVESIYETANPTDFQIIAVDDASEASSRWHEEFPEVLYVRNSTRMGSPYSKHHGVELAKTPHVMLIDGHMRFKPDGWLDRIAEALAEEPRTAFCTTCLYLSDDHEDPEDPITRGYGANLRFRTDPKGRGWPIVDFRWAPKREGQNYEISCLMGANYAFRRDWFLHLRGLSGLRTWGMEEPFLSLKTWLAGGQCKVLTDVEIGHKFTDPHPDDLRHEHIYYNALFLCHTLLPPKLARTLAKINDQQPALQRAQRLINSNADKIAAYRRFFASIRKYQFYDFASHFDIEVPGVRDRIDS